jgi:hypothetical protein
MSLLDDAGVVAGLEGLEPAQPRRSAASDPAFQASMNDLDDGLPPVNPAEASEFLDDPPDEEDLDEASVDWKTVLRSHFVVWVFCGSLGAAVAALVFHAEVSRLMWRWSGAATSLWR